MRGSSQQSRVSYSEGDFLTLSGDSFFYRSWRVPAPVAVAIIVHDLGEDGGEYKGVAEYLARQGFSAYAMDLRGHGKSCGERGHADSFERLVRDLGLFVSLVSSKEGMMPYLLGQGFGALLALSYAARKMVAGLVLSSPLLSLKGAETYVSGFKASLMNLLISKKKVALQLGSKVEITVRLLREVARAQSNVSAYASRVDKPTLIIYDPESDVVEAGAIKKLYEWLGAREKKLVEVSGGYSILKDNKEALEIIVKWIMEHVK